MMRPGSSLSKAKTGKAAQNVVGLSLKLREEKSADNMKRVKPSETPIKPISSHQQ